VIGDSGSNSWRRLCVLGFVPPSLPEADTRNARVAKNEAVGRNNVYVENSTEAHDRLQTAIEGIELEAVCNYCEGKARWREEGSGRSRVCDMCDGSGYLTTELGGKILDLIRHNFLSLSRALDGQQSIHERP
jgi:hypothetical protein